MIQMNLFTKLKLTHRQRKQTPGYQTGKSLGLTDTQYCKYNR